MSNSRITNKPLRKGFSKQKGFSVVELVIVIAVIGILAAVLIPTFNSIIESANESRAKQEITNAMKEYTLIDPNVNFDDYVIVYYENNSDNTIKVFGYKDKELYIIESEYLLKENELYVNTKNYLEVSTESLSNFSDHIRLFKYKKEYDIEYVEYSVTLGSEQSDYLTSENKELLEGMYLPGEKVVIRPEKIADGVTIFINGELAKALYITDEPYEYEFVMPSYNVQITFQTLYILENSEVSFSQIFDFTNNLDINNINEIYYIPNQTLYNGLSSDFTRCFYYKNTTTDGIDNINRIIRKLTETSYKSCNDVLDETGLPREKYIILANDNIYEFYYDEYIYYNGSCYKNESYEALFTDSASEGFTFITNYMQITEYTQPIYKNGVKQENNIDLRSLVFKESDYGLEELLLPTYDESSEMTFTGIYGSEGDYGSFKIIDNYTFKKGTSIYKVLSDFSFEEYKKTYTVRLNQEQYGDIYIIFDENSEITYDDLFKYLIIDDEWFIKDVYFFSYSLDNRVDIFNSGNIILDSNKTIYYTYFDHHIKLSVIYPFISDLQIERIKELYVVNDDSDESGMSTCKYIENNDNTKEFLENFINSLKDDWYVASNLSYDPGIYGPSVPEKYIINTDEETYEFVYILSPTYKEKVYMKETPLVQIPDDIYETYYTLVKNDMTEEDYIKPVKKNYPDGSDSDSNIENYYEVIDKNTDRVLKAIDIRKAIFQENIAEDVEDGPKYIDTYFNVNILNCKILYDDLIKCTIGNKVKYYEIVSDFTFRDYLDEVSFRIMKEGIPGLYTPRFSNKEIILERGTELSKDDIISMLDIRYFNTPGKYYIKLSRDFGESGYITLDKNSIIGVLADFGYEIKILDEQNLYVKEEVANEWNGIFPYGKYKLELIPKKDKYVRVLINNEIVKTIKPSSYVAEYLEFTLDEDIVISFEEVSSLEELIPNELYYKDMYPFISDIDVEDIKEIIKIDPINSTLYNGASFITIDSDETRSYAFEFLRFFREEKCSITDTNETLNTSKYVIVTNDGIYKIEDVNVFERTGKIYKSNTLAAFPDLYVTEGLTIKYMQYIIKGNTIATFDVDMVVFNQVTNVSKIYGYTSEIKLDGGYGSWIDPYYSVYSSKDVVYNDGEGNKEYLKVVNSYSFEEYFTSCINIEFSIDIYRNDANQNKYKMCTVIYKVGDVITKDKLTKLLSAYGCNSSTIYSTYDVTNDLVMEELFIENEEIMVEDNMSIYISKKIY